MQKMRIAIICLAILLVLTGCASPATDLASTPNTAPENTGIVDTDLVAELEKRIEQLEMENERLRLEVGGLTEEPGTEASAGNGLIDKVADIEDVACSDLISVERTAVWEGDPKYKSLYPDWVEIVIKNNFDETLRHFTVGILGYDENGYPIRIKWDRDFSDGHYEKLGWAEDANVLPGETHGEGGGWKLSNPHNVHHVLACVKEATFYDGTEWENPGYLSWLAQHKEKELPSEFMD